MAASFAVEIFAKAIFRVSWSLNPFSVVVGKLCLAFLRGVMMKMREKVHTKNSLIGLIKSSFIGQVQGDCCCCIMYIVHSEMYVQEKRLIGPRGGRRTVY